jgi:hypothetical protein
MIQAGYVLLIAGGVLFVIGIIFSIVSFGQFANLFLLKNTLINEIIIHPGSAVNATTQVTDPTRPVTITIHIKGSEGSSTQQLRNDMRLVETVIDPAGTTVSRNEFSANLLTAFTPKQVGNHVLIITNVGTDPATIDATFGYMPFIIGDGKGQQQVVDFDQMVIPGAVVVIGFFVIIAGIIIVIINNRKRTARAPPGHMPATKNPPKWLDKLRQYGLTLITGSLTVGLLVSVLDYFMNPQLPPPSYPSWLITILIATAGVIFIGIAQVAYKIWQAGKGQEIASGG